MSQVLHIFRKDARQLRVEILLSLLVLLAIACTGPLSWRREMLLTGHSTGVVGFLRFLPLLLLATWGLLITRVVQTDRLVGDTQFWLTRPYDWKRLLAAKALFLAAFLYLPLLIVQWELLWRAGFHPVSLVGALIHNLLLITGEVVLPIFAIASVTSNLARVLLVVLSLPVCFIGTAALEYVLRSLNGMAMPSSWFAPVLSICVCSIAIALQYRKRRTTRARLVLLLIPLYFFAIQPCAPLIVARAYGQGDRGNLTGMNFAYNPRLNEGFPASRSLNQIVFGIPLSVAGSSAQTPPAIEGFRISIASPDGSTWQSQWTSGPEFPFATDGNITVWMPPAVYEKFRHKTVSLQLTLAVALVRESNRVQVSLSSSGVAAAGSEQSVCGAGNSLSRTAGFTNQTVYAQCQYALRAPRLTRIAFLSAPSTCPSQTNPADGGGWSASAGGWSVFAIDPVLLSASVGDGSSSTADSPHPCLVSDVVFTEYEVAQRTEAGLTIQNFELPQLDSASGETKPQPRNESQP